MLRILQSREIGKQNEIERFIENKRVSQLALSKQHDFSHFHTSSVNCCDLDSVELRYLLSGGEDGAIGIHDMHTSGTSLKAQFNLVSSIPPSTTHPSTTTNSSPISTLQWYPLDTGLFISSGPDGLLKIWDTNAMSLVTQFKCPSAISCHRMSPSNLLVALGNRQQLQIVDLKSGSSVQKLNGCHGDDVVDICWSPRNQHQLISAGRDGQIMVWDVRRLRSCCFKFKRKNPPSARAHSASITTITPLPDTLHLISFSNDNSLIKWDLFSGHEVDVHYESIVNNSPCRLTVPTTPSYAFVPSNNHITILDLNKGIRVKTLKGHLERVTCLTYIDHAHHLVSASRDHRLLFWSPDDVTEGRHEMRQSVCKESIIDYFSYNAEEYYKDGRSVPDKEVNVGGGDNDVDPLSSLTRDNWSDDDD